VRAFIMARELFRLDEFDAQMRQLPVDFPTSARAPIYVDMRRLLDRAVRWIINNHTPSRTLAEDIDRYAQHISPLHGRVSELMQGADVERVSAKYENATS